MTSPADKGKYRYAWPVGVNLAFLLFMVAFNGPGLGLFTLALALFNVFLGFVFLLLEWLLLKLKRRRGPGAGGFFLSSLLLLLIGFGMCARETRRHQTTEVIEAPSNTP